jgi:hypothetical protein
MECGNVEVIGICPLEELPTELQVYILCQIPDISSLLSTIEASRTLFCVFKHFGGKILLEVLENFRKRASFARRFLIARTIADGQYQEVLKKRPQFFRTLSTGEKLLLYQLYLAIRRNVISRRDAMMVFKAVGQMAEFHRLTSILVPFGWALAHTLDQGSPRLEVESLIRQFQEADVDHSGAYSGWLLESLRLVFDNPVQREKIDTLFDATVCP